MRGNPEVVDYLNMLIGRWAYVLSPELHSINAWFMYIYYAIFIFSLMFSIECSR